MKGRTNLSFLFQDLNERFFKGRLPAFRVRRARLLSNAGADYRGHYDPEKRTILIRSDLEGQKLRRTAWNKGLKHITGDWVYFQGADDLYYDENVFANMVEHLVAHEAESKIIYGILERVNLQGKFVEWLGKPWNAARFRGFGMCIPHTATFQHRSLFEEYGEFNVDSPIGSPYEFFLRYLKDHDAVFVPFVVASMIIGGESNRPENLLTCVREDRRAQRKHGTLTSNMIVSRSVIYVKAYLKFVLSKILPDFFYWWTLDFIRMMKGRRRMYSWRSLE